MLRRALCLVLLTILAGCGGLTPRNTSAGIVRAQVSLSTGGHQQFIFVSRGVTLGDVIWSADQGVIDSHGRYSALLSPCIDTVSAHTDTLNGSATVLVN